MKYWLVVVTPSGYSAREAFYCDSVREAAKRHLAFWRAKSIRWSVVMRDATGKRYSAYDSHQLAKEFE